jgi:hypothetical protein
MRSLGDPIRHFNVKAEWKGWKTNHCFIVTEKDRVRGTSRSLKVLKKTEKGLLIEYQRSFSFWKKSSARGQMLY